LLQTFLIIPNAGIRSVLGGSYVLISKEERCRL
jgi:hypothetical protein